ncbi:hypothetical protein CPter291_0240 [Collimonas pratensis]|uniref:Uncharacterized protein n=1 Tax=Collimonas pratensis TaxID=279113 RepID=A0ABN4M3E4_9BURK|nr:hypothetical protein CPter291_0240 [Collimonas pratensis]
MRCAVLKFVLLQAEIAFHFNCLIQASYLPEMFEFNENYRGGK